MEIGVSSGFPTDAMRSGFPSTGAAADHVEERFPVFGLNFDAAVLSGRDPGLAPEWCKRRSGGDVIAHPESCAASVDPRLTVTVALRKIR